MFGRQAHWRGGGGWEKSQENITVTRSLAGGRSMKNNRNSFNTQNHYRLPNEECLSSGMLCPKKVNNFSRLWGRGATGTRYF